MLTVYWSMGEQIWAVYVNDTKPKAMTGKKKGRAN